MTIVSSVKVCCWAGLGWVGVSLRSMSLSLSASQEELFSLKFVNVHELGSKVHLHHYAES